MIFTRRTCLLVGWCIGTRRCWRSCELLTTHYHEELYYLGSKADAILHRSLIRHGTHSEAATPGHLQQGQGQPIPQNNVGPGPGAPANTGAPGFYPSGKPITSSPVQTFHRPQPVPVNMKEGDIGAAAMAAAATVGSVRDPVHAAMMGAGSTAGVSAGAGDAQAAGQGHGQVQVTKRPSMSFMSGLTGMTGTHGHGHGQGHGHGHGQGSGQGQGMAVAGVGALDEAMHRKRAMSLGKNKGVDVHEARR